MHCVSTSVRKEVIVLSFGNVVQTNAVVGTTGCGNIIKGVLRKQKKSKETKGRLMENYKNLTKQKVAE